METTTESAVHHHHAPRNDYSNLYTPIAIVVAGALIALGIYFGNMHGASAGGQAAAPADGPVDPSSITTEGIPFIGKPDAPVTMFYWYDYQCPFCKAVEVGHPQIPTPPSFPEIIAKYVDTGKLKIVYKDYPFLSEDSTVAATYKFAVWELYPEKFLEWHHKMMEMQDEEHAGFGNEATIVTMMKTIPGIDAAKVKAYVTENKTRLTEVVNKDREEGSAIGITGTPGFVIGTKKIDGARPLSDFTSAIEAAL